MSLDIYKQIVAAGTVLIAVSGCANQNQLVWTNDSIAPQYAQQRFNEDKGRCIGYSYQVVPVPAQVQQPQQPAQPTMYLVNGQTNNGTQYSGTVTPIGVPPATNYNAFANLNNQMQANQARDQVFNGCMAQGGWRLQAKAQPTTNARSNSTDGQDPDYANDKYIVEQGGYCNETADCVRGLACYTHTCATP